MKRLVLSLLASATLHAMAQSGQLVDMQIERRNGMPYQEYSAQNNTWVAGEQGENYQLTLHNKTGERVLVVVSVDGVNVINGKTASANQSGYVLAPWGTTTVTGWRKSLNHVAQFYFTRLPDSYAARTGRPADVGVIGAAVFKERMVEGPRQIAEPMADHANSRERSMGLPVPAQAPTAAPAPLAARAGNAEATAHANDVARGAAPASATSAAPLPPELAKALPVQPAKLGTGHGESEYSSVTTTTFERASEAPNEVLSIRYDSHLNLAQAGIIPRPVTTQATPQPFPADGFVPDPPRHTSQACSSARSKLMAHD